MSATLARQVIVRTLEGTLPFDGMCMVGVRVDRPCVAYTLKLGCWYGEGMLLRSVWPGLKQLWGTYVASISISF